MEPVSMKEILRKKKAGKTLLDGEIAWMIKAYTAGEIPDYQMSALLMAICFNGLSVKETTALTMAMRDSGDTLDLSGIEGVVVDKHSTGGVGDKVSLVLLPLVSSCGVKVAKMSGRGLGFTGGTIDKLDSIPGFTSALSEKDFIRQVNEIGMADAAQTGELAPADKLLYALRDVTETVDELSLIASSIMSKKLASGADAVVLDVKCGDGAFMKNRKEAKALARIMCDTGILAGKKMCAVISDMSQPLGCAIGNALEVKEAIECLKNRGPADVMQLVMALGVKMLLAADEGLSEKEAQERLTESLNTGRALAQFARFVKAQHGDAAVIDHPEIMGEAPVQKEIRATKEGFVSAIACEELGRCVVLLGGGRSRKEDRIDPAVGIVLKKKRGDKVEPGEVLAVIHAATQEQALLVEPLVSGAFLLSGKRPKKKPVILDEV